MDQKQRLALLSAFKISTRARRLSADDTHHFRPACDLAAHAALARSTVGRTRRGRLFSRSVGFVYTRPSVAISRVDFFLLGWIQRHCREIRAPRLRGVRHPCLRLAQA